MSSDLTKEFFNEFVSLSPETITLQMESFREMIMMYNCAIREIKTKLETFTDEFEAKQLRNPIDTIKNRIKRPISILEKMKRKGLEITMESITENLYDIAGIRVICPFIEDIYTVAEMLVKQDDITLIRCKDYIKNPKENGYRSLHLVVAVPVFFSDKKVLMKVEVQIRTIAMDFWASLEHQIRYKKFENGQEDIARELLECSEIIFETDIRMQDIQKKLEQRSKEVSNKESKP